MSLFAKVLGETSRQGCKHPVVCGILLPGMAGRVGQPKGNEHAGRVRAAVAYSGLSVEELVESNPDLKVRTVYRYMETGGPASPNGEAYRLQIADACGVPARFMLEGFAATEQPREDELAEVRRVVRELQRRLDAGEEAPARRPA
jgi:hypothetical protein